MIILNNEIKVKNGYIKKNDRKIYIIYVKENIVYL